MAFTLVVNRWKSELCVGNLSVVKIYIIRPKPGPVAKNATPRPSGWECINLYRVEAGGIRGCCKFCACGTYSHGACFWECDVISLEALVYGIFAVKNDLMKLSMESFSIVCFFTPSSLQKLTRTLWNNNCWGTTGI